MRVLLPLLSVLAASAGWIALAGGCDSRVDVVFAAASDGDAAATDAAESDTATDDQSAALLDGTTDTNASGDAAGDSGDADADVDAAPPPYASCAPGGPCQDLELDVGELTSSIVIETRDIASTSCAVSEGTIFAPGQRRLLRFATFVTNVGTADLLLGDPKSDPVAFEHATCHGHYHFRDYADYVLKKLDGTVAVQGHKESFCVEDNIQGTGRNLKPRPPQQVQGQPAPPDTWDIDTQTNCLHPGLHIGWADGYFNTTEGNWLDITGLAPGDYKLSVTVNPHHTIEELDYANNSAEIPVHVPDPSADGVICPATLDAIYKCTSSTQRKKCFAGLTTTDDCTPPKQCVQFVEIAHSAACQ